MQKRHFEFAFQRTILLTYGYEKNLVAHGELAETDLVSTFFRLKKKQTLLYSETLIVIDNEKFDNSPTIQEILQRRGSEK